MTTNPAAEKKAIEIVDAFMYTEFNVCAPRLRG